MKTDTTTLSNEKATGTPNNPNAKILIYALQHLGYDNYDAVCDIIDNSIDANATKINIYVDDKNDNFRITIQDNGCGMSKEILDEALKLGSDNEHDALSDLGKFGMGLSTAGLSLADRTIVLTKMEDSEVILKSVTDVEVIKSENAFVKYLGEASEQEKAFFKAQLEDAPSGTIVILEDCFGVKNKKASNFSGKLIKEVARKYRKFMDSVKFYVNDKRVAPDDPLMLSGVEKGYETEIYSDDDYEVNWIDKVSGNKLAGKVHAKLVILPDFSEEKAKNMGINMTNQGFYVLRNNREIECANMIWFTRHNSRNRIRGELSFDSSLDEAMGINFTKKGIDMVDSVKDALQHFLKPQISSMTNKIQRTQKEVPEDETISHTEAAEVISKKARILITPAVKKVLKEDVKSVNDKTEKTEAAKGRKEKGECHGSPKHPGTSANVRFDTTHYGQNGVIFEAEQEGKTTVIRWNVDHPFYTRFVRENAGNKTLVTSVDFLIYSLAVAQIQALGGDDERAGMIGDIINIMSINMKHLLS